MIEWLKAHKWLVGGGIVGLLVYFLFLRGGSSGVASGAAQTDVQAATDLQSAQLAAQSQGQQVAGAVQANQDSIAGQIALAQIQGQYGQNNNQIAASIDLAQINATQQTTLGVSTLQAQVQEAAYSNATQQYKISADSSVQMQTILANALTTQARINANVQNNAIAANQQVANKSVWSRTFG